MTKKYTNPSSDVIAVLAGLDQVDPTISDFVKCVDGIIRNGAGCKQFITDNIRIAAATDRLAVDIRQRAIEAALSMAAGAYQTGLVSYFTHRDLFPSLMKARKSPSASSAL